MGRTVVLAALGALCFSCSGGTGSPGTSSTPGAARQAPRLIVSFEADPVAGATEHITLVSTINLASAVIFMEKPGVDGCGNLNGCSDDFDQFAMTMVGRQSAYFDYVVPDGPDDIVFQVWARPLQPSEPRLVSDYETIRVAGSDRVGLTYYVDRDHSNANDDNEGTEEGAPWRTIVHAGEVVGVGDTVLVKAGVYQNGMVHIENSGERGQEVILAAYPGDEREAVIRGGGILGVGVSHVVIDGLKILEAPGKGIRFEGKADIDDERAENITIRNCHTYDTCSSSISIWGIDGDEDAGDYDNITDVLIENNLLELGTHGCHNEIITVAHGATDITVRYNEIRLGDPNMEGGDEGIDFKLGVSDSSIYGNYIHDLSDKAIYLDGGDDSNAPENDNILIYNNVMKHLPSAGLVVTTEGPGHVSNVFVFNNLAAHNEGDGFRVYEHPDGAAGGGTVRNVFFINNTAYDCGSDHGGGFRVNHETATGIVFRNNIAWNNADYDVRGEFETLIEANLGRDSVCEIQDDPSFVDPQDDDFHLRPDSPAIDVGLSQGAPSDDMDGNSRTGSGRLDLGCYEYIP
ncbi:MAG: hypothetical protein GY711_13555 [bacterium]|nr:hypothetical protein [bacterium]